MTRRSSLPTLLLTLLGAASTLGCYDCRDVEPTPVESGDYTVTKWVFGPEAQQWALGAQLTIDREEGFAILRYTRDGTEYEVHYMLEF
jgi:hypothetical protein